MPIHETVTRASSRGIEIELFTLEAESASAVALATKVSRGRADRLAKAIHTVGLPKFTAWWTTRRLAVSLQLRLYVESILFSIGGGYAELVSGFKPLRVPLSGYNRLTPPIPKSKRHREGE